LGSARPRISPCTDSYESVQGSWTTRYVPLSGLALLLAGELILLRLPYTYVGRTHDRFGAQLLTFVQHGFEPFFTTGIILAALLSWHTLREELTAVTQESTDGAISFRWLGLHLVLITPLVIGTVAREKSWITLTSLESWIQWLCVWALIGFAALVTWCFAALPPHFWLRWIRRSQGALIGGLAVGLFTVSVGRWSRNLWWLLQRSTFASVALVLKLLGQKTITLPDQFIVGTSEFSVKIAPRCSGIEGIVLVTVVVGAYLWYERRALSFPRGLLLIPAGALAMWLLNSLRIALLILIGNWSEGAALRGFHSVAGWLFFDLAVCGVILIGDRFARADAPSKP
jgi:exosortase E/protease (VPEID-CTERM system)